MSDSDSPISSYHDSDEEQDADSDTSADTSDDENVSSLSDASADDVSSEHVWSDDTEFTTANDDLKAVSTVSQNWF